MKLLTPKQIEFLISLFFTKHKSPSNPATITHLVREQGFPPTESTKHTVLKGLIPLGALVYVGKNEAMFDLYYVNKKVLQEIIDKQELVLLVSRYKKETAILWD